MSPSLTENIIWSICASDQMRNVFANGN